MTTEIETQRALAGGIEQVADLDTFGRCGSESACDGVELPFELAPAVLARRQEEPGLPILALRASGSEVKMSAAKAQVFELLEVGRELGARNLNLSLPLARLSAEHRGYDRYRAALNFCYDLLAASFSEAEAAGVDLAVEVPTEEALHSPVELAELLDAVPTAAVGVCLEDARFARPDELFDWLATLSRRVFSLRLNDRKSGDRVRDTESKHLPHLRQVLDHIDYQGLVITPMEVAPALRAVLLPAGGD